MSDDPRTHRYRTADVQSDAGSFRDLLLPASLIAALESAGFTRPSPVQKAAIPIGRVGTDMIVQAKSGTGKTAVFAAILLERVSLEIAMPQALVLAPTRELAIQSFQVIQRIASGLPEPAQPTAAVFVGGLPTADDEKKLRRTCHIIVGTPGRLCALATAGALVLGKITCFVVDEADQLMSGSFLEDTKWLTKQLQSRKQVLAFSATYTPQLLNVLEPLMRRPQKVLLCEETVSLLGIKQYYKVIGSSNNGSSSSRVESADPAGDQISLPPSAAVDVPQINGVEATEAGNQQQLQQERVPAEQHQQQQQQQQQQHTEQDLLSLKVDDLLQLLSTVSFHQAIVFCNKKPAAEWLSRRLTAAGCPATYISADLPQMQRMSAMEAVTGFKVRVIISTDVMARGVDLDRVNLVVNLDLPADAATYVHRVGRTGRFGSRGIAVAFVTQSDLTRLQQYLQNVRGGDISPLPDIIPDDFYTFQLESDWEQKALQQLLAAPTTTPPSSPPPMHKQPQQQQRVDPNANALDSQRQTKVEPFWGTSADSISFWQQQQQQQQQGPGLATAESASHGGDFSAAAAAAAAAADRDLAAEWDAWAQYYISCGYSYPYENPYRQYAAAGDGSQPPQQQQQQQQQPGWSQDPWTGNQPLHQQAYGTQHQQQQQHSPGQLFNQTDWQHGANGATSYSTGGSTHGVIQGQLQDALNAQGSSDAACNYDKESVSHNGCEIPTDDDELDPRAALLLSSLSVVNDLADPATGEHVEVEQADEHIRNSGATAAKTEGNGLLEQVERGSCAAESPEQLAQAQMPSYGFSNAAATVAATAAAEAGPPQASRGDHMGPVCHDCWVASYAAWQRDFEAWRQQYEAWRGHVIRH